MKIYDVVVKDADGNIKEVISSERLSKRHWDNFLEYEPLDLGLPAEVVEVGSDKSQLDKFAKEQASYD